MAEGRDIKVRFLADTDKLRAGLADADGQLNAFGDRMQSAGKSMMKVGGMMTAGITLPIIAGLGLATKAAAEEAKEQEILAQVLRNTAGATTMQVDAVEDWITATQNATAVADSKLRPAFAKLMIGGRSVEQVQKDLAVALDISAARGLDLETVSNAMAKAAQGNVGALQKLGIATKDAAGNTLSYDQILANASATMGGTAAAAADTAEGRMAIMQLRFEDLKETIGAALIPILEKLIGWVSKAASWFENITPTQQKLILVFAAVAAAIGPVVTVVGALVTAVGFLLSPVFLVIAALALLAAGFVYLYRNNEDFRRGVQLVVEKMRELWEKVQQWWPAIRETIATAMEKISEVIGTIIDAIAWAWRTWGDEIIAQASNIWNTVVGIVQGFVSIFDGVIDMVRALIDGDWSKAWEALKQIVTGVFDVVWSAATGIVSSIGNVLSAIWSAVQGTVTTAVNTVIGYIESVINFAIDGVNKLIDAVNLINPGDDLGKMGRVTLNRIGGVAANPNSSAHYNALNARPMAAGGLVVGPTLAMIGEGNEPEAVLPLSRLERMMGANTGGIVVNITAGLGADPTAIQRAVVQALSDYRRRNGAVNLA